MAKTILIELTDDKRAIATLEGLPLIDEARDGYLVIDTERDATPLEATYPDGYEGYEAIVYYKNARGGHTHVHCGDIPADGKVTFYMPQDMVLTGLTTVLCSAQKDNELIKWDSFIVPVKNTGIDMTRAEFPTKAEIVNIEKNEAERQANEAVRQAQEAERQENEAERIANELERIANELARQAQEAVREAQEAARVDAEDKRAEEYAEISERLGDVSTYNQRLLTLEAAIQVKMTLADVDALFEEA